MSEQVLLFGDHNGIYIPQRCAQIYSTHITGVDPEVWDILLAGPYHDEYWWAWDEVLDNAVLTADDGQRYFLYHSQDLWAIPEGTEIPEGF